MRILIVARPYTFHGGVESATAGLLGALVAHGHDVHRAGPGRQPSQTGVTEHPLPLPPLPSAARGLGLALAAAVVARRRGWDVVQSHERTLVQDVYRAGEGCHRAYLEAMGEPAGRRLHHAVTLVLGRGDTAPYLRLAGELGVAERLVWLGTRPDIERWYAGADALALPTRYEPFGNVHLEALASGLPVVTSVIAGGAEAVDERCGATVAPDDPAGLAAALEKLRARNPAELRDAAPAAAEPFTLARQAAAPEGLPRPVRT